MKKISLFKKLAFVALAAFIAASCNKAPTPANDTSTPQDVTFSSPQVSKSGTKSSAAFKDNLQISYASIVINGTTYTPAVYYIDGVAYTQAIKLVPGTYTVTQFLMMNDNQTPDDPSDDVIVSAAPDANSTYANFVNHPLPFDFTVAPFEKNEIDIEILLFTPQEYTEFGFDWFTMSQVTIREQLFFGDISVKHPADYAGSLYENQSNGLQVDMPAIFKIDVYRNGAFLISYNNESFLGEGDVLHVAYPDADNSVDHFKFELFILVKSGTSFEYKKFHTWEFDDAQTIPAGSDGVVDFVLGNSNTTTPDLLLPPYQNLPVSCSYKITGGYAPGSMGSYVDAELGSVGAGFDIANGTFASWCGDKDYHINVGHLYSMDVYSSLYPDQMPAFAAAQADNWARVNWIFNHLDNYTGYTWGEVQGAIWIVMNGWTGPSDGGVLYDAMSQQMASDSQSHTDFTPLPGGWAAVVFIPQGTDANQGTPDIQTMFIQVDP